MANPSIQQATCMRCWEPSMLMHSLTPQNHLLGSLKYLLSEQCCLGPSLVKLEIPLTRLSISPYLQLLCLIHQLGDLLPWGACLSPSPSSFDLSLQLGLQLLWSFLWFSDLLQSSHD